MEGGGESEVPGKITYFRSEKLKKESLEKGEREKQDDCGVVYPSLLTAREKRRKRLGNVRFQLEIQMRGLSCRILSRNSRSSLYRRFRFLSFFLSFFFFGFSKYDLSPSPSPFPFFLPKQRYPLSLLTAITLSSLVTLLMALENGKCQKEKGFSFLLSVLDKSR